MTGRLRSVADTMSHTHGLVNPMDRECSPEKRCLRCEIEAEIVAINQDARWAQECLTAAGFEGGRSTAGPDRALTYIERIAERTGEDKILPAPTRGRDYESSLAGFRSMQTDEWNGLLLSLMRGGVLEPEENEAFLVVLKERSKA